MTDQTKREQLAIIGRHLRRLADRIDRPGAPKWMGASFTIELGKGLVFHEDGGRGCPLWYYGDADYERAHTDAEKPAFTYEPNPGPVHCELCGRPGKPRGLFAHVLCDADYADFQAWRQQQRERRAANQ